MLGWRGARAEVGLSSSLCVTVYSRIQTVSLVLLYRRGALNKVDGESVLADDIDTYRPPRQIDMLRSAKEHKMVFVSSKECVERDDD